MVARHSGVGNDRVDTFPASGLAFSKAIRDAYVLAYGIRNVVLGCVRTYLCRANNYPPILAASNPANRPQGAADLSWRNDRRSLDWRSHHRGSRQGFSLLLVLSAP